MIIFLKVAPYSFSNFSRRCQRGQD